MTEWTALDALIVSAMGATVFAVLIWYEIRAR